MKRLIALAVLCLCVVGAAHAFVARGNLGGNSGIPILLSAPTVSPAPTTTQAATVGGPFVGNSVSAVGDTWQNCSPCTFSYRWYYLSKGALTAGPLTANYNPIPGLDTVFWPQFPAYGDTAVFAFETATNAFGSITTTTPITTVTRVPINTVGGGNVVYCTAPPPSCSPGAPIDNTLQVGDWITATGITATGPGYSPPPLDYTWAGSGSYAPSQAFNTLQNISTEPYQLVTTDALTNIKMAIRYTFLSPFPPNGGNTLGYNTFPVGPVIPAGAAPGTTIQPPLNTAINSLTESPPVPAGSPVQAYVGFILSPPFISVTGSWNNVPWNFTFQWMYCSTSPGSGIAAPCAFTPNPAVQATGNFTFGVNPSNGNTINLNGTVWTFVNTLTTGNQIQISGVNLQTTLINAASALNASSDTNTALMTYSSTPTAVKIIAKVFSAAGNAYTLTASNATPSGATLSGGLTASGGTLPATAISGATAYSYLVTSADKGRQLFQRETAYNTGGTTVQDGLPALQAIDPSAPHNTDQPTLSGYATVGNVGGGAGGSQLVGATGTWTGPPTNYIYTWFSCPSGNPTCTTLATGPSFLHPLNVNVSVLEPIYQVVSADLTNCSGGCQIRMRVRAFNATSPLGVTADTAPSNAVTTFSQTALGAGPLGVYPAGRDPLTTYNCAPAPTSFGTTYYVNNQTGSNSNNGITPSTPFLTYAKASGLAVPGDRILLQGVAAWNSVPNDPGNYGAISGSGNNVSGGATDWITIGADTSTGAKPMVTSATFSGRGWNLDGLWIKNASTFVASSGDTHDFIFQNGFIGYYPDLATAEADYNDPANCGNPTCGYNSIGEWFWGFNGHPAHVINTAFSTRGSAIGAAQCVALINNKIWFTEVGVDMQLFAQDVLIEGNDIAYFTVDAVDLSTSYPVISHLNNIHDPISAVNPAVVPHMDAFQTQPFNQIADRGTYGQEFDSNIMILNEDPGMQSFVDQPYCTFNGLSPCSSHPIALVGDESCLQWSNNFNVGTRWVNNMCLYTEQFAFNFGSLATIANNTFLGWDQQLHQPTLFHELASENDYWANNATDNMGCYGDGITGVSTFTNNILVPLGPNPPVSPRSPDATCPVGWGTVDSSTVNPFTATIAQGTTTLPPAPATFITVPSNVNLIPPGTSPGPASSLFKTGSAAFGVPTVTINGTAHTSPPNVGAY